MTTIDDSIPTELSEWTFPSVDAGNSVEVDLSSAFVPDVQEIKGGENSEWPEIDTGSGEVKEEPKLHPEPKEAEVIHYQVLDKLKLECEARLDTLDKMINKLKSPASLLGDELIELVEDIIRKVVKKIIFKEISTDNTVLPNMINELKSLIDTKNGMTAVYLSAQDYQLLEEDKKQAMGLIEVDAALSSGDIVIKSNYAEVRALLNERMDQVIRIENE